MNIIEKENGIILEDVADFDPKHIFECGQCFRWRAEEDGSYTGVAMGKVINVKREGNNVIIDNTTKEDYERFFSHHLTWTQIMEK